MRGDWKKRFASTLSFVIALTACSLAYADTVEELVQRARHADSRFNYQGAVELYRQAAALEPDNPDHYIALAKSLIGIEELDEANAVLSKALALDPDNAEAHVLQGIYYRKVKNDFALAQNSFEEAIRSDPKYERAYDLLGDLLVHLQEYDSARAQYEELIKLAPKSEKGYLGLGNVLLKQSQWEESAASLQRAIEADPYEPESYRLLGQALGRMGKRDEAKKAFELYQQRKKDAEELLDRVRLVRRSPKEPRLWFNLGQFYLKRKDADGAIDSIEKGLELDPNANKFRSLLGALYLQGKNISRAQYHLQIAIENDPDNADNYNNLGVSFLLQDEYAAAVKAFERAIALGKDEPGVRRNLAISKRKLEGSLSSHDR